MRLKYEKRLFLHKQKYKKSNHLKSTSMDNILLPQKSKNQCLNKLPQKNQVNSKLSSEKTYLKNNIPNYQTNSPDIFQSEERVKKSKNYLINARNSNYHYFKHYSNTNYNSSFNSIQRKTCEILDNSYLKNYYISLLREKPLNVKKIYSNSLPKLNITDIDFIRTNRINNKYKDVLKYLADSENYLQNNEHKAHRQYLNNININNNISIKNVSDFNNMFNKHIQLLKPAKKNINFNDCLRHNQYIQKKNHNIYGDEYDSTEGFFIDSDYHDNSGRNEIPSNNANESYLEMFKYNITKSHNFINKKYSNNNVNNKKIKINKSNNNVLKYSKNLKQKPNIKCFTNLKIEKNIIQIQEENNKKKFQNNYKNLNIKNNKFQSIIEISGNSFYINGNRLNNQIESTNSDINKDKEKENLKEKINIVSKDNKILKEENNNFQNTISLSEMNTQKEANGNNQNIIDINNNIKNELEKLKTKNEKIKKEKDSLISLNISIQEQKIKIEEELNNLKKENELKSEQNESMKKELLKLKEEINEELKTSKINLEKLNENFNALKNENEKYKEKIELLKEEKELELNQKQKLQEENKALKLQQIQLKEEIENLKEKKEELENTANIKDDYDQLYEEFNKLKKEEKDKYDELKKENDKLKEELEKFKNKIGNDITNKASDNLDNLKEKEEINFPEPVIIKRTEKRKPSKFKKDINFNENMDKEGGKENINEILEMNEKETLIEENTKEKEEKNYLNEIKLKSGTNENNEEILESKTIQQEIQDDIINKNVKEDPFDYMIKLLQNKGGKILNKKKMSKKMFEE